MFFSQTPTLTKGNNFCDFLFASLDEHINRNGVNSYRKEFASPETNSFLNKLSPFEMGKAKKKMEF